MKLFELVSPLSSSDILVLVSSQSNSTLTSQGIGIRGFKTHHVCSKRLDLLPSMSFNAKKNSLDEDLLPDLYTQRGSVQ